MVDRDEALVRLMFAVCFEANGEADFARDPLAFARRFELHEDDAREIAASAARFPIYRKLVHNQIGGTVRAMLGDVAAEVDLLAPGLLDKCVTTYLATYPPRTRHVRDVAQTFFLGVHPTLVADERIPRWIGEVIDVELTAHEVGAAPDADPKEPKADLALDRPIRFAPHLRLRSYQYRVLDAREPGVAPARDPVDLLAYRDSSFAVQWLEITPDFAEFIRYALQPGWSFGRAMAKWSNCYLTRIGEVREAEQAAFAAALADLGERGLIEGAAADDAQRK